MITGIFFWRSVWVLLMIQKTLCTPYFSHRVFEEIIYWKTACRWSNELGLIKGECYNMCVQSPPWGATVFPKEHTSWDTPLHLYISVMICGIQTTVLSFVSLWTLFATEFQHVISTFLLHWAVANLHQARVFFSGEASVKSSWQTERSSPDECDVLRGVDAAASCHCARGDEGGAGD